MASLKEKGKKTEEGWAVNLLFLMHTCMHTARGRKKAELISFKW
jgi:hypothetical protein